MRTAHAYEIAPDPFLAEGDTWSGCLLVPGQYCCAADNWGFVYAGPPWGLGWTRSELPDLVPPPVAAEDGLFPAVMRAYNPQSQAMFVFAAWRYLWGTARLGHDGAWYVLAHNPLEWGPWQGLRVYRHDLTRARAKARPPQQALDIQLWLRRVDWTCGARAEG